MLTMEAQRAMNWGESSGECWETVCAKEHMIKCVDVEDHKIKGGTDCSSYKQPARREDKDSVPSAKEARRQY